MSKVNWYGDDVALLIEGIALDGLLRAAYQIEGEYKINARVDTGFMRNSAYVHSEKASTFQAQSKTLDGQLHETVNSPPPLEEGAVFVGVGANYAIYREIEDGTLYNALMRVSKQIGGLIQAEARGKL